MKSILDKIADRIGLNNTGKSVEFIERFYIRKYGSRQKAEIVFKKLKDRSQNDDEFQLALQEKLKTDLHFHNFKSIAQAFQNVGSISNVLKSLLNLKNSGKVQTTKDLSKDFNDLISPAFEKTFFDSSFAKNDIINYINENITFKIAHTRKELGYPDPRTFNYWLKFFFDSKYENKVNERKSKNSGVITLFEYTEIVSAFILSYDEVAMNLSQPKELLHRLEQQKQTQKQILKELTNNNYSLLRDKLEDLERSEIYKTKYGSKYFDLNKRKIPYSLVSIIHEHINNGWLTD